MMSFLSRYRPSNFLKLTNYLCKNYSELAEHVSIEDDSSATNFKHIYCTRFSKDELIQKLADSVVYNKDDIVVLNKPYGIGVRVPTDTVSKGFVTRPINDYYLQDVLPDLARKLGFDSLEVTKVPERYMSGVLVLAASDGKKNEILTAINQVKSISHIDKFLVVSVGQPNVPSLKKKFALSFSKEKDIIIPKVSDKWSVNACKKKLVLLCKWKHKVLSTSRYASLVEVKASRIQKHYIRLIMATKVFSPVLGDHIHGNRVRTLMGVYLPVNPFCVQTNIPQALDKDLLNALQLTQSMATIVPTHIHLHSVVLPNVNNSEFFVSVPPPEFFRWTCERLELDTTGIF